MTIYSVNSEILYEAPLTEDALIKYELMGDYYIELPFDAGSYIDIPRGSYIDHEGTRYTVMENILPEPKAEGGYHYAVKFWAGQSFMKNRKLFWLKGANKESSFHITTTIDQFGQLVVDNMNEFMPGKWELSSQLPADALTVTKTISFEGDSCWDAVSSIAEAYGIEWWVHHDYDRMELYFGKLEGGNLVDFKVGEAITSIPSQKGDDSQYGTRFYVYGSNQNLPEGYGDTEQGGTVHHVSNPRLMLPSDIDYIDAKRDMTPAEIIEQVVIFEDVYPKNTDTVTAVTTVQRPIENAAEGQPQTFTAYQLIAANTPFLPSDVMENETLRLVFNSGALTGVEFEVDLRDADDNHIDPFKWKPEDGFIKKFELIAITEQVGDTVETLPDERVHPVVGDEFVLLGVRLSDDKVREAEEELLQRGEEWKDEHSKDTSVYNCPTNPVYCKHGLLSFALGQRVRLYDPRFDGGYRDSRIQGFEKRIWNEYIATYTIGDNAAYTRIGAVESSVTNLKTTERTIGMILDELASTAKELSTMFEMVEYNKTKMIRANYDFFSVGGVTAGGIGSSSGSSGGGGASYNRLDAWADYTNDKSGWVLSALLGKDLDTRVSALANAGYITASALDPYAKSADVANTYATKTALQGVDIRVQAIEYIFEKDNDGVINKWSEIVDFLAGVEGTTLDSILEQFATKDSLSGYLPLSGGSVDDDITLAKAARLKVNGGIIEINTTSGDFGVFLAADKNVGGTTKNLAIYDQNAWNKVLHSGNYTDYTYSKSQVDTKLGDYLPLTLNADKFINVANGNINIIDTTRNYVSFHMQHNGISKSAALVYMGKDYNWAVTNAGWTESHKLLLHEGNYTDYTVPKTGGTFSGNVTAPTFIGNLQGDADRAKIVKMTANSANITPNDSLVGLNAWYNNSGENMPAFALFDGITVKRSASHNVWELASEAVLTTDMRPLYFRRGQGDTYTDWEQIAFTSSNVASATKLQTARTIWGQSFDGSANISGDFVTNGSVRIGDAILSWDSTNKCVTIKNANTGEKASLFVDGGVTGTAIN